MRVELLDPRGELTVSLVQDTISLTDGVPPSAAEMEKWSPLELHLVYDWAMREHLNAAGNGFRRRTCPWVLGRLQEGEVRKATTSDPAMWVVPTCAQCGERPAACLGHYEGSDAEHDPGESYACDECCGHGNEDGHCEPVKPVRLRAAEAATELDVRMARILALESQVTMLTEQLDAAQAEIEDDGEEYVH